MTRLQGWLPNNLADFISIGATGRSRTRANADAASPALQSCGPLKTTTRCGSVFAEQRGSGAPNVIMLTIGIFLIRFKKGRQHAVRCGGVRPFAPCLDEIARPQKGGRRRHAVKVRFDTVELAMVPPPETYCAPMDERTTAWAGAPDTPPQQALLRWADEQRYGF